MLHFESAPAVTSVAGTLLMTTIPPTAGSTPSSQEPSRSAEENSQRMVPWQFSRDSSARAAPGFEPPGKRRLGFIHGEFVARYPNHMTPNAHSAPHMLLGGRILE